MAFCNIAFSLEKSLLTGYTIMYCAFIQRAFFYEKDIISMWIKEDVIPWSSPKVKQWIAFKIK